MPDDDFAALKATLQRVSENLQWIAEQLIELRKEVAADLGRLNGREMPPPPDAVVAHAQTFRSTRLNAHR